MWSCTRLHRRDWVTGGRVSGFAGCSGSRWCPPEYLGTKASVVRGPSGGWAVLQIRADWAHDLRDKMRVNELEENPQVGGKIGPRRTP